jgi:hypothetical protein
MCTGLFKTGTCLFKVKQRELMVKKLMDADEILLHKCKSLIQAKLGWEESESWTNHDFQVLSEKIQEATGVNLSVATLKRIWGKVKYDSKPTITTLNTLAQFTGYESWRAFKQNQAAVSGIGNGQLNETRHDDTRHGEAGSSSNKTVKHKRLWRSGLVGTALCGGILFILVYGFRKVPETQKHPAQYSFSSKKVVSEGVPNSVIFDYDASAASVDSVFIQQSWDERRRTQVSRDGHQHTSIYYTPGFFQAKLVVAGEIVKEHNLWITSNGWMAIARQEPVPVYFKDADFRRPGMLSLPVSKLKESNIAFQPETPWTSYYNVKDFGDIRTDNFIFETEVRSEYKEGSAVCQFVNIVLLLEGSVVIIPLSIKGCVSDLFLAVDDHGFDGKKTDLSAFGCDLSQWVKVRCEVKNGKGSIFINDLMAHDIEVKGSKKIVGLVYRFQGTGSINEVRLSSQDGTAKFEDTFE